MTDIIRRKNEMLRSLLTQKLGKGYLVWVEDSVC